MEINMKAYIQEGKHILKVDSDRSLMKIFVLNTSIDDPIDLFVDVQMVSFVPPEGDRSRSLDETIEISDDEESQSNRDDNGSEK